MFQNISKSFSDFLKKWTGKALSEKEIKLLLTDIRHTLIDADTAVDAANLFVASLEQELLSHNFTQGINPQQQLQARIHTALTHVLGQPPQPLISQVAPLSIILLAGLQGAGKTTSAVKLAKWLTKNQSQKVAVTSLDFQRPAAQEQLKILAESANITYLHAENTALSSLQQTLIAQSKAQGIQTLILDTAGRLHLDEQLMQSLTDIQRAFKPNETLLVMDSQTGQDAAQSAKSFNDQLTLSSCILSKCDADSKGGAALSVRTITKKPISFIGTGEKLENFEPFDPALIANRMLDLGDVAALVEKIKQNINQADAAQQAKKMAKGHYDLADFLAQIQQMKSMGGVQSILNMLPGAQAMPEAMKAMVGDEQSQINEALILSMTPKERKHPMLLSQNSRRDRVLRGSGRSKKDFQQMMKQYEKMQSMIKKISGSKIKMAMEMMKKGGR